MVRLLAWNILHGGGGRRMPRIALRLVEQRPDVIALCEYRRAIGGQIRGILADHGWTWQACTCPPAGANGLLLASRLPLARAGDAGPDPARWIEAEIPELGLAIGAAHVPCGGKGKSPAAYWRALLDRAWARATGDCVLLGDFNAGVPGIDGSVRGGAGYMARLEAAGYVDAWRALHPTAREMSWLGPAGTGARIDHVLLSPGLAGRLRSAWYAHEARLAGESDHSAIVVSLEPAGWSVADAGGSETRKKQGKTAAAT